MKNLSPINENKDVVTKEYVDPIKSQAAINRTTLGTQCKNLFDWKNATYSTSLRLTQTKTESGISVTSTGSWAVTAYKLPILEVGTAYIFSTTISDLSVAGGKAYVVISTSTSSSNIVKAAEITNNGTATIKFEATSNTMYVLFYPNYSDTVYTNSFTASNIMLRYADIMDDTYEPYQPSLIDRCLLKDTAGINLGHAQSDSITIDNLSAYTALWINVAGAVAGINFITNLIVPVAYLAKSTSNSVQLAGGIPSSAYTTSSGVLAAKNMSGYITAKVSGNTLSLTISDGIIGTIEVVSLM